MPDDSFGAAGEERPKIGRPRLEFVPAPRTALNASVHIFLRDRCLSLTDDEVWLLERAGLLRFRPGDPSDEEFDAATQRIEEFRRWHTDIPTLFRRAAAHWFDGHSECNNCPAHVVMYSGFEERFLREHPQIEVETRRRADEYDLLVRKRYAAYPSNVALFIAAKVHEGQDHDLCLDDACPLAIVSHLHLWPEYTASKERRRPLVDPGSQD
jgi:hypothetical protein